MGVVTYIGAGLSDVTLLSGQQVRVVPGVNYTFTDPDCSALLAQQPTKWLAGDQHTQTLVPPNYPTVIATGSYVGDYSSTKTYMKGNVVTGPWVCLKDSTLNVTPGSDATVWVSQVSASEGTVRPGTMLVIGTSLEQNEGSDWPLAGVGRLDPNTFANPDGPINWASWFQGAALRVVKNVSLSGLSSAKLINAQNSASSEYALGLNPAPGFVYLGHFTGDDPGTLTPAQSAANDLAIYTLVRAVYSQSIIVLPTLPTNNINTNNWATRATVNAQRRTLALQNANTLLFDFEAYFINPATGLPPATLSQDNIHPNPIGAMTIGKALGLLLAPYLPGKSMVNDYTNDTRVTAANGGWGVDAMMSGTPGANTTATNWSFAGPAGAVRNLVARGDQFGNWQEVIYGGTAGAIKIFRAFPAALPQGAVFQAECEVAFLGTLPATGITDISLSASPANAGFAVQASSQALGDTLANRGNYSDPGNGTVLTLRTPPATIPNGTMSAAASFITFQINGTAIAGGIRIGRLSLLRLA